MKAASPPVPPSEAARAGGVRPPADFVERWCERTATSKAVAARQRPVLADARSTFGFHPQLKEIVYPLTYERAYGGRIVDVDGNEYVDLGSSFGAGLFGYGDPEVTEAVHRELDRGLPLVPHSPLLADVAELVAELTGCERLTFTTTGTEAMMAAVRLARAATGRSRIAIFEAAFHGTFEAVLARSAEVVGGPPMPAAPGVPPGVLEDAVVLPYGEDVSLEQIAARGDELAAVLVEPLQMARPWLVPLDFLRSLRELCDRHGIVLLFDEIVTGFRLHPGGFQGRFDIRADLTAYGKAAAGGLPIGIVAGDASILDEADGGVWEYGPDGGEPRAVPGIYGGTFTKFPLSLAAARVVLSRLKREGPAFQEHLDERAAGLVARLREVAGGSGGGCRVEGFSSVLRFVTGEREPMDPLFRFLMLSNGVHTIVGDRGVLMAAHDDADLDGVVAAYARSLEQLAEARGG